MTKEKMCQIYTSDLVNSNYFEGLSDEVREMIENAKEIQRFTGNDLPVDVVIDTVYTHTQRTIHFADTLPISTENKELLKMTLVLHDLPEVISLLNEGRTADTTSPEKEASLALDEEIAKRELQIAKVIFTDFEFSLYSTFEESGNYLKGKSFNKSYLTQSGILAQLIDKIDANIKLHTSLAAWASSDSYNPSLIIPDRSFAYATRQYPQLMEKIEILEDSNTKSLGIVLLQTQMQIIKELWAPKLE